MALCVLRLRRKEVVIDRVGCCEDDLLADSESSEVGKRRFSRHDKSITRFHKISLQPFDSRTSRSLVSLVTLCPQDETHVMPARPPERFPRRGIVVAATNDGLGTRCIQCRPQPAIHQEIVLPRAPSPGGQYFI